MKVGEALTPRWTSEVRSSRANKNGQMHSAYVESRTGKGEPTQGVQNRVKETNRSLPVQISISESVSYLFFIIIKENCYPEDKQQRRRIENIKYSMF